MTMNEALFMLLFVSNVASQRATWSDYSNSHTNMMIDQMALKTCWHIHGTFSEVEQGNIVKGFKCDGKMKVWTHDNDHAMEFCRSRFPYHIIEAEAISGSSETRCVFQQNLVCLEGWYQIKGKCYWADNRDKYTFDSAKKMCSELQNKNSNLKETQLAEYYSQNLGGYLEDMQIRQVWVSVPDFSPYFSNVLDTEAGVYVADDAWRYEMKAGTIMYPVEGQLYGALCESTPEMNLAESFLLAQIYAEIYPMFGHELGLSLWSGSYVTISQNNAGSGEIYNNNEIREKCNAIGMVLHVKSWPQSGLEDEHAVIKGGLTEHRYHLVGSVKQDGKSIDGYRDYDEKSQGYTNSFDAKQKVAGDYSKAHSLTFTKFGRHPTMAGMRAPALCSLHSFTYEIQDCKPVSGFRDFVQYDRQKKKTRMCHYIQDGQANVMRHDDAVDYCANYGMVLSGFEEMAEITAVHSKMYLGTYDMSPQNSQMPSHYWMGGVVPCATDCYLGKNVDGTDKIAIASWDPRVSMDNSLLDGYNHAGWDFGTGDNNRYVAYRAQNDALHTHNDEFRMFVLCAKYADKLAVKQSMRNV